MIIYASLSDSSDDGARFTPSKRIFFKEKQIIFSLLYQKMIWLWMNGEFVFLLHCSNRKVREKECKHKKKANPFHFGGALLFYCCQRVLLFRIFFSTLIYTLTGPWSTGKKQFQSANKQYIQNKYFFLNPTMEKVFFPAEFLLLICWCSIPFCLAVMPLMCVRLCCMCVRSEFLLLHRMSPLRDANGRARALEMLISCFFPLSRSTLCVDSKLLRCCSASVITMAINTIDENKWFSIGIDVFGIEFIQLSPNQLPPVAHTRAH